MCAVCGFNPCVSRCPNAPEPIAVHICSWCKEPIFIGDEYIDTCEGPVCRECIEGMTIQEFMELTCETFKEAKEE